MNAIMGKIVSVSPGAKRRGLIRVTVRFKAAALLPARSDPPAWLADQVLEVQRDVADVREIGGAGDGIALTPDESEPFLVPLIVEPATIEGKIPADIGLTLHWWKSQTPPEYSLSVNGIQMVTQGRFRKVGKSWVATALVGPGLEGKPRPFEIEIAADALRAICAVVPPAEPAQHRFLDIRGEGYRMLNPWYAIDIAANQAGGAIIGFRERGRGLDHLAAAPRTQKLLDEVGHADRVVIAGQNKLEDAKLTFTTRQQDLGCAWVEAEGMIDEGKNARSTASYRLLDRLPILVLRRDARLLEPKPDEKKKTPADSLVPMQLGFRHAAPIEGDGRWGSQVIAPDGDRLGVIRACFYNDFAQRGEWFLRSGWAMLYHPIRRSVTLFLVDGEHPPELLSWSGPEFLTLEPMWLGRPYRPPAGTAFTLAISAGEIGGAAVGGGWVACRARVGARGVRCAAIARLKSSADGAVARFTLAGQSQDTPLKPRFIEGVGEIHFAIADFPKGMMKDAFDATVADIPSRREP